MIQAFSLSVIRNLLAVEARGLSRSSARPRIYCANHTSHLDAALLLAALPEGQRARPVAAADYWRRGLRRVLAERLFRTVFIERGSQELNPLAAAFQALRQGDSLVFFPEGTRGSGSCLQPLKPGIFYLARAFSDVEIVPVWIDNACHILPKGAWLPLPSPCSLTFGAALRWQTGEEAPAFLDRLRDGLEACRVVAEQQSSAAAPARAAAVLSQ
jgi:1-acyl-sn-glycerol-3-phosphate acyltransferase